jgi:HAD superfamily hydrolase (TIGR01484 family)
MDNSANLLQSVRLLVTDADGTLIGHRPEFESYRAFKLKMDDLRSLHGLVWVVCTGRGLRSFSRVFLPMRVFGVVPDFVIARHAYIYEKTRVSYKPHWLWNLEVLALQFKNWWQVRRAIPQLRRAVISRNPFVRILFRNHDRICFRFDDDGAAAFGAEIIREEVKPYRFLQVFHHLREIDVRTVPFTKGLAVAELARHLDITPDRIMVIGDGHNDISMMELHPHCKTACPANAAPEVVETVRRMKGHIAENRSLAGVLEVLDAYETGAVNSNLPAHWQDPSQRANPLGVPRRDRVKTREKVAGTLIFVGAVYTTLVALASFGMVPFAQAIIRPYQRLIDFVELIIGKLF